MQIFWIIILFFFIFLQFIFIKKNPAINRLFVLFLFVAFFMWYFVPILLTISGNTVVIDFLGVELTNYCSLAIKELTLYLLVDALIANICSSCLYNFFLKSSLLNFPFKLVIQFFLYLMQQV